MTFTMIYNLGLNIGLTVSDIDKMTVGEIVDIAYYKANIADKNKADKDAGRKATQADYDSF